MFKIDGANTVVDKPAYGVAGTPGWFKQYGPGGGLDGPGTIVTPDFLNMLQGELLAILAAAGIAPDKSNDAQLLAALNILHAGMPSLRSQISGLTYANGSDATNDIDIAAGGAMDSTGALFMVGASRTKQLDAVWAVGNDAGGRLSGALADGDFNIWQIRRADTGVVDYGFETTANAAPTLPTNYTHYRHVGWFKRSSGVIVPFKTFETGGGGLEFLWSSPTLDVDLTNTLTTARLTAAVKVPQNFSVLAHLDVVLADLSASALAYICCPDLTDLAPSFTAAPLSTIHSTTGKTGVQRISVRTSATGTVAARADLATVDSFRLSTIGFNWSRR